MANSDNIGVQQLDALLRFLPIFEQPGYSFGSWNAPPGQFPYFVCSDDVSRFITTLYEQHIVISFDWTSWTEQAQHYMDGASLDNIDLETVRKLLTTHVRADRFTEGHLAQQLESGHITALLRRLKTLRDT